MSGIERSAPSRSSPREEKAVEAVACCEACGEPVSVNDEGGCVGAGPYWHFRAGCLLEAVRQEAAKREGAVSVGDAVDALTDALVEYDVPTDRILVEFRRLIADYGGQS